MTYGDSELVTRHKPKPQIEQESIDRLHEWAMLDLPWERYKNAIGTVWVRFGESCLVVHTHPEPCLYYYKNAKDSGTKNATVRLPDVCRDEWIIYLDMAREALKPQIHPEVLAELKRLGVDDLPWEAGPQMVKLEVWGCKSRLAYNNLGGLTFEWLHPILGHNPAESYDSNIEEFIQLARARYNPPTPEADPNPQTAFDRVYTKIENLKPSNVTDTKRELLDAEHGGRNLFGLLRLAVLEGMPEPTESPKKPLKVSHDAEVTTTVREAVSEVQEFLRDWDTRGKYSTYRTDGIDRMIERLEDVLEIFPK